MSIRTLAAQKERKLMCRGATAWSAAPGPKWNGVKGIRDDYPTAGTQVSNWRGAVTGSVDDCTHRREESGVPFRCTSGLVELTELVERRRKNFQNSFDSTDKSC